MISNQIFEISSIRKFEELSLQIFQHQSTNNKVYAEFLQYIKVKPTDINQLHHIPFLPIQFYKSHQVLSSGSKIEKIFLSSGTTQSVLSKHYITNLETYKDSFTKGFEYFYGSITDYTILALLPSYSDRSGSSLTFMMNDLIKKSRSSQSAFYLDNLNELAQKLMELDAESKKVLLVGVSFALLDLIEINTFRLKNTIIMETGGMKGKRKELIRKELHEILCKGFGVNKIHSEYGMTELLSQAYSKGNGVFTPPPWMKVLIRDTEDALSLLSHDKSGGLNIIDLANINSCSFIATQDLGKTYENNTFEILGRFDNSDIRGCNLMILT